MGDEQNLDWLKNDIRDLRKDVFYEIARLNDKMDEIRAFKWQIIGGSIVASLVLTVALNVVLALINKP